MNPLQEIAQQLREEYNKQAAEEKTNQQQYQRTASEQLSWQFSKDLPWLHQLLLASGVDVAGKIQVTGQKLILSSADKQLTVFYEGSKSGVNTWRFHGKDYAAGEKESEQQLIIALAEAFSMAQSKHTSSHS